MKGKSFWANVNSGCDIHFDMLKHESSQLEAMFVGMLGFRRKKKITNTVNHFINGNVGFY